ncbi:MAG: hypothetical protein ACM3JI_04555 [Anaerolineae bacterium]
MSNSPTGSPPPIGPSSPPPHPPQVSEAHPSGPQTGQASYMNSPFAKLLGPTATPAEIKQAVDNYLNMVIAQIKKDEQRAIKELKRMKKIEKGENPD